MNERKTGIIMQPDCQNFLSILQPSSFVTIYTDGACQGNPGPGGWGAVLQCKGVEYDLFGSAVETTNNRTELMAAIQSLEFLPVSCQVKIYTDSHYLKEGISIWIIKWKQNGWRTYNKKPVKNQDLWERLDNQLKRHQIEWVWVRGHSGNELNEKADALARKAIIAQKMKIK